jgi:hypothetical protein
MRKSKSKSYDGKTAITPVEYQGLQHAYDHFNTALFAGSLPVETIFITYQRKARSFGYFAPKRFSGRVGDAISHELALNPDAFIGQTEQQICQTLVHEMAHVWQHVEGTPGARGYHNKEWAAKMKAIGLQPSSTGMVGGKETGQRMQDYILPNGPFTKAYDQLAKTGWKLNWQSAARDGQKPGTNSKTKFTCPSCQQNVWGKPDVRVTCTACEIEMPPANVQPVAAAPSYEPMEAVEPKRKRGRPPGSKNKPKELAVQPYDLTKRKRGRPKGSKNKPKAVPSYDTADREAARS